MLENSLSDCAMGKAGRRNYGFGGPENIKHTKFGIDARLNFPSMDSSV